MFKSGFFNSLNGDRVYNADELSDFYLNLVTDGVLIESGDELKVVADTGLRVKVLSGWAYIKAKYFHNTENYYLLLRAADRSLPRIDRIVLRLDKRESGRNILITCKEGIPGKDPVPPELTRNENGIWEMSLAQITVKANAISISSNNIADERSNEDVCGYAVFKGHRLYFAEELKEAVGEWSRENTFEYIADGTLTKSKFASGAVIDPKPNFQQLCSVPVKHITGDSEKSSPTSFQSLMFASRSTKAEKNTVIMLRTSDDESSTEAVVLDLTNPKSIKRYSLSGSHAGHANSAVLVNGVIYVATGHNVGDKGIAAFSYPGFVYLGRCGWENYCIWSIAYDYVRKCFYMAGWSTEDGDTNYKVYTINGDSLPYSVNAADSSDELTKMFDYPEFFTSYATNVGAMSYCNDTFYISKHEPHNIVRMNLSGEVIDVSEFPERYGEPEQLAFCNGKIYVGSQRWYNSMYLNNVYEISYDRTIGQTRPRATVHDSTAYVNHAISTASKTESYTIAGSTVNVSYTEETPGYDYIFRKGYSNNAYCCIEEALDCMHEPWTHTVFLLSNVPEVRLDGADIKLIGANIVSGKVVTDKDPRIIYTMTANNCNINFANVQFICKGDTPGLTINNSNVVISDTNCVFSNSDTNYTNDSAILAADETKKSYIEVYGSGTVHTVVPIVSNLIGTISGSGSANSTNTRYKPRPFITVQTNEDESGAVRVDDATGVSSIRIYQNRLGSHVLFFVGYKQNTKCFVYRLSNLLPPSGQTDKTIIRKDSFVNTYAKQDTNTTVTEICIAEYSIKTVPDPSDDGSVNFIVTVDVPNDSGTNKGIPNVLIATF